MTVPRTEKRKIPRRLIGFDFGVGFDSGFVVLESITGEHDPEISHETRIPSTVGIAAGTSESPDWIPMYIVGAAARPGIYHIARGVIFISWWRPRVVLSRQQPPKRSIWSCNWIAAG